MAGIARQSDPRGGRPELEELEPRLLLSGITLITHGAALASYGPGQPQWVDRMSQALEAASHDAARMYRVAVVDPGSELTRDPLTVSADVLHEGSPASGEIIVQLDWSDVAGFDVEWRTTAEVAAVVVPKLLDPAFLTGLGVAAVEMPIHLIGHSRGASLVSEIARGLGQAGVWVDQTTFLDPNTYFGPDPVAQVWSNVEFADDYYEQSPYGVFPGVPKSGAFNRRLGTGPGGTMAGGYSVDHDDVHLWYYGSVDPSATDWTYTTGITMDWPLRDAWFAPEEEGGWHAGWLYSRLGGGDRTSACNPGNGSNRVVDGLSADFGGVAARQALSPAAAVWCNVGDLALAAGRTQFAPDESVDASFRYQDVDSGVTITFYLDSDLSPYDGGLIQVAQASRTATGAHVLSDSLPVSLDAPAGVYYFAARITDGAHTRYAYVMAPIGIVAANHAPVLDNSGAMKLASIGRGETASGGTLVSAILASAGDPVTDADAAAREGIAVVASDTTHGSWQYTLDGGATWSGLGTPGETSARLLAADADTRVRFVPAAGFSGTVADGITFRAWDRTSGVNGAAADATVAGGSHAFSAAAATARIRVVAPDAFEPAFSFLDMSWYAADVTSAVLAASPLTGLTLHAPGNVDWYRFTLPYGATGLVQIALSDVDGPTGHIGLYSHPLGSLGIAWLGPMSQADAAGADQAVTLTATGLKCGSTWWVGVRGWLGTEGDYTLTIAAEMFPPDAFEPNDTSATATDITPGLVAGNGTWSQSNLSIHRGTDVDWFRLDAPANADGNLTVQASQPTAGMSGWVTVYRQLSGGFLLPVAAGWLGSWSGAVGRATVYGAQPGTTYWIKVDNNWNETGGYDLSAQVNLLAAPRDRFDRGYPYNDQSWFATSLPVAPAAQGALASLTLHAPSDVDWFLFTVPAGAATSVKITLSGVTGGLNAHLALYGSVLGSLSDLYGGVYTVLFGPTAQSDAAGPGQSLTLSATGLTPGRTCYVKVSSNGGTAGGYDLGVQVGVPGFADFADGLPLRRDGGG